MPQMVMPGSILGHSVKRTEDPRFLTGTARYTEDLEAEGALHAAFVRSQMAHGRIASIDRAEAAGMPGVAGVFLDADLGIEALGGGMAGSDFARPALARDTVRFVGEAIAVVVAETRAQAQDAADAIVVDYEPLQAVVDPVAALAPDAPILFPEHGSNVAVEHSFERDPGALEDA